MGNYDLLPIPKGREIVIDTGYLASGRHIVYGLAEVDIARARQLLRARSSAEEPPLSFTAFLVASLARAIQAHPQFQAYRDWRRRLVVFHDVDVVTLIEPQPGAVALPHIIRGANRKTVREISDEIRQTKAHPERSEQHNTLATLAPRVPRYARLLFFWVLKQNPHWFKRLEGTVVVTSKGMFTKGGVWGSASCLRIPWA